MAELRPGGPIYFLTFYEKTVFFKLDSIFPECYLYREGSPRTDPLMCLHSTCPSNKNCMETLAKRVFVLFQEVLPQVHLLVLYFRKQSSVGLGAGVFWKNMAEPAAITMNPSAWDMIKERGLIFEFRPGPYFFLTGSSPAPEGRSNEEKVNLDLATKVV
jgi:hypothetical protein